MFAWSVFAFARANPGKLTIATSGPGTGQFVGASIITALAKAGGEVTIDQLMKATKLNKNDVTSWLAQTGKKVKAVENTGRGKYQLNFDAVK